MNRSAQSRNGTDYSEPQVELTLKNARIAGAGNRHELLSRFLMNRSAIFGSVIIGMLCIIALLAPVIALHPYAKQNLLQSLNPPLTASYPLGTDEFGRDVYSRLVWGSQVSLKVGVIVTGVSMVIGVFLGCISGFYGGTVDLLLSSFMDLVWGFPLILVALLLVTVTGPGINGAMVATGLVAWAGFARIVRGEVLALRDRTFVLAARSLGAGNMRVIVRHIFPNIIGPILVMASFIMATAVVIEASLSFFGLGAQPPTPSWGSMLNDGRQYISRAWWLSVFPGVAIAVLVLGFNILGDGLRDVFDPRMRN